MRILALGTLLAAAAVAVGATPSALQKRGTDAVSRRPTIACHPKHPSKPIPSPGPRSKICHIQSHNDGKTDDSKYILEAFHECNNGGHAVFKKDITYLIGTAMDWTFLKHIDIDVQGEILFTNDTTYWQEAGFSFVFQNVTTFFKLGGTDVWIYGGGTINGNGQVWYDLYAENALILRPVLFGIDGLHDSVISDLVLRYSPQYYHFVANSTNVIWDNINIAGASTSNNTAKNTDGWDTYRSDSITIQNSHINNGDDCVSFKPNSTNILVQNLFCNGSHGISVGSLGQYPGEYDLVENIYVTNISMHNATDGARIKVWPNAPSAQSVDLQGGGGTGHVENITYTDFFIDNVDYSHEVDQCYGQKNLTLCEEYPSPLTISNVLFSGFSGKTSTKYQPEIAAIACSSKTACSNIRSENINVVSPNGTNNAFCLNVNASSLEGFTCTDEYLGFN